jgi:hypothetical protein
MNLVMRIFSVFLFWGTVSFVFPQNISVQTSIDTNQILIGDQVRWNIEVVHDPQIQVQFPEVGNSIKIDSAREIEILSSIHDTIEQQSGMQKQTFSFLLTVFDSGYYVIPPVELKFKNSTQDSFQIALSEPILLTVRGIEIDTTAQIKPIKEPLKMPFVLSEIIMEILLGVGVLVLLAAVILYFKFRKKKAPVVKRIIRKEPPHETALKKLRELEEKKLWQQGQVKQFYSELSEIVREYIELRWNIPALESTTDEIMNGIIATAITGKMKEELGQLLQTADLVKFAKANPLADQHSFFLQWSIDFVKTTKSDELAQNIEVTDTPVGVSEKTENTEA